MTLFLRILVNLLLGAAVGVQALLSYKVTDKRTRRYKSAVRVFVVIWVLSIVGSIVAPIVENNENEALRAEFAQALPRRLTDTQRSALVSGLRKLSPVPIFVTASPSSGEPYRLASELHDAIQAADWPVGGPGHVTYSNVGDSLVLFVSDRVPANVSRSLAEAFQKAQLPVVVLPRIDGLIRIGAPVTDVELFVNVK
jgi:hypothetical protein